MLMTSKATQPAAALAVLTSSEKDILQMIADGYRPEEIGTTLGLSQPEIESLLTSAEEKLGAKNRLHAVTIAVLNGHITVGPESPE